MSRDLSGVFTALVTPFKNGDVDFNSLKKLLRFQLDGGVNGFVVNGTTAESPTLTPEEVVRIFEFVKTESAGQVPLIMGTGSNSTAATVQATQRAAAMKADAALVVVPYYNKPSQRGLFQHFQKVAECSDVPILLYNVPGRTITKLELDTVVELSHLENVIGIKEATGDIEFAQQLVAKCSANFLVTGGDDGAFLGVMGVGGRGVISVAAHLLPREFRNWSDRAKTGDQTTRLEFEKYAELNSYLYVEANPIPIKAALHMMGLIATAEMRLPMTTLTEPYSAILRTKMLAVGLL